VFENQHQWMLKLVRKLKNQRSIKRTPAPQDNAGYQQVPAKNDTGPSKRAQEMMAEAQRLSPDNQEDRNEKDT
ncbi:MAG: hypothetical protein R3311_03755, partial [Oceanisphaera sp.]|nr:hypothetical protein [Oceanisphaera sp.]